MDLFCDSMVHLSSCSSALTRCNPTTINIKLQTNRWSAFNDPALRWKHQLLTRSALFLFIFTIPSSSISSWHLPLGCFGTQHCDLARTHCSTHGSNLLPQGLHTAVTCLRSIAAFSFFSCLQALQFCRHFCILFLATLSDSCRKRASLRSISSLILCISCCAAAFSFCKFFRLSWRRCTFCDYFCTFWCSGMRSCLLSSTSCSWSCSDSLILSFLGDE